MLKKIYSFVCNLISQLQSMNTEFRSRVITKGQARVRDKETDEE